MTLTELVRPKTLDEVVGQKHLLAPGKPFRRLVESSISRSLVFYGPPGTGKTTVADILASQTGKTFRKINATTSSLADLKDILGETTSFSASDGILLYIDEIQYFNKKQQQSLLEYVEDGRVTLICSTTENPYFYVYPALISRSAVFEFKSVESVEIEKLLVRALSLFNTETERNITAGEGVLKAISENVGGDVRKAVSMLENLCYIASDGEILIEDAFELMKGAGMRFDRSSDAYYDSLSALQKSIRGSDANAAVFYLAKILESGGILSACRRLMVISCEDVGLAYPLAAVVTKACVDSALQVGMPEARIPLAEAAVLLATAPKSNSSYLAYDRAAEDFRSGKGAIFPRTLQNVHAESYGGSRGQGYKYPHDFPNHYVKQQYLPDDIKDKVYYTYGNNKTELSAKEYWDKIKKE